MNMAEKEYKKRQPKTTIKTSKKEVVSKPSWLNQAIEEEMATDEEMKKLESRLNR